MTDVSSWLGDEDRGRWLTTNKGVSLTLCRYKPQMLQVKTADRTAVFDELCSQPEKDSDRKSNAIEIVV